MKRIFFFYIVLSFSFLAKAQEDIVVWNTNYNAKTSEIEISATLLDGWHIFSQFIEEEIGPVPTQFTFDENAELILIGKVNEPEATHQYDPNFEASLDFFVNEVKFTQKINAANNTNLKGTITYMACNEFQCIPPSDKTITIKITK